MTPLLKRISVADVNTLQAISHETFRDTFAWANTPEDLQAHLDYAYALPKLITELQNPHTTFWFLYLGDKIAGYLKLNDGNAQTENVAPHALEVERIYIRTPFKRQGLGSLLLQHAAQQARDLGEERIWLGVWEHNEPAKKFYQKMGFHEVGAHIFPVGNDPQKDLILLKELTATNF